MAVVKEILTVKNGHSLAAAFLDQPGPSLAPRLFRHGL